MPQAAVFRFPDGTTVAFPDLASAQTADVAEFRAKPGTWLCGGCSAPGHIATSMYGNPFFRHAAATSCSAAAMGGGGESVTHLSAKDLIAQDLEHLGFRADTEYLFNSERHKADVAVLDKSGGLHGIVEIQRSYEPVVQLSKRDRSRVDACSGRGNRVLWVTDRAYRGWADQHPFIVLDSSYLAVQDGLYKANDLNTPIALERPDLLERWAADRITRVEGRAIEGGQYTLWIDTSYSPISARGRKRLRHERRPASPTVCILCADCGSRVVRRHDEVTPMPLCDPCIQRHVDATLTNAPAWMNERQAAAWKTGQQRAARLTLDVRRLGRPSPPVL